MATSTSQTEAVFARAYAASILKKLHITLNEREAIYLSPIARRGVAAGDLIPQEVTNFQVFRLGDTLFSADNPGYTGEHLASYILRLGRYLLLVDTGADNSQAAEGQLKRAQDLADSAAQRYHEMLVEAQAKFRQSKESDPTLDFWTWIVENVPEAAELEAVRDAARAELSAVSDVYFGPRATEVWEYVDGITKALSHNSLPEFNMAGVTDHKIIENLVKKTENAEPILRHGWSHAIQCMPLYSIGAYANTVQAWIDKSSGGEGRSLSLKFNASDGERMKWKDHGFREPMTWGTEPIGFFPLFSTAVKIDDKIETKTLKTEDKENSISLELSMLGLEKFEINPGAWDVPNIKTLFPKLLDETPKTIDPENLARATSLIVGYDVELKVIFEGNMGKDVNEMYDEARSSGGSMTIFGIRVSSGDDSNDSKIRFEDVQWDGARVMTISLPPTRVQPTVLAVIAETFDLF